MVGGKAKADDIQTWSLSELDKKGKKKRRKKKPSEEVLEWSDDADAEDEGREEVDGDTDRRNVDEEEQEQEQETEGDGVYVEEVHDDEEVLDTGEWLRFEAFEEEEDDRYPPDWDPFGDEEEV